MLHKPLTIVTIALCLLVLLAAGVAAQAPGEEETAAPVLQPMVVALNQAVPVTLTVAIPGPTGPVTVEVPVFLALDIRIGLGDSLTATVAAAPVMTTVVTGTLTTMAVTTETVTEADEVAVAVPTVEAPEAASPTPTALPARPVGATLTPTPVGEAAEPTPEVEATEEVVDEAPAAEPTATPVPAVAATATPTATPEEPPVAAAPACPDPRAVITSPGVNQTVSGTVDIVGSATHENFNYYKVEYAPGADVSPDASYAYLTDARVQVSDGVLASFDSANLDNGAYTLKLTVVDNTGNFPPPCTVTVIVQN